MDLIPESELENYWGMYDNDCFWRCVSYLRGAGITESAAASFAYEWFISDHGIISGDYELSTYNDSAIPRKEMRRFLRANDMMVGSYDNNRIVGLQSTNDLAYYRNHPEIQASQNHNIILESVNSDGSCQMYDPQNHKYFTDRKSVV